MGLLVVRVLASGVIRARALSDRVAVTAAVPVGGDRRGGSVGTGKGSYLPSRASAGWSEARVTPLDSRSFLR